MPIIRGTPPSQVIQRYYDQTVHIQLSMIWRIARPAIPMTINPSSACWLSSVMSNCMIKPLMDLDGCLKIVGHAKEELMDSINRDHDIHSYHDYIYDQKYWHLIVSKRSSSKRNTEDNYYSVDGGYAFAPILPPPSKKVTVR